MTNNNSWTSPSGVEVKIDPFMSMGWKFTKLWMTEVVGGTIAEGSVSLLGIGSELSLQSVTEVHNIKISLKSPGGGPTYEIFGFITTRSWTQNALDIKFLCIPDRRFFTEPLVTLQTDITDALGQLWNGDNIDIRCKSDINNDVTIQQLGESNYSLCKRLALSFKKNSIFCFGVEKFMIKDIVGINSRGEEEPKELILGDGQVTQTSGYNMNYSYKLYKEAENPWGNEDYSSSKQSKGITALTFNDDYYLVSPGHYNLLENYVHNKRLMESRMYTSLTILTPDTLPIFKIGDTFLYKRSTETTSNPFTKFFVSKMTYFISSEGEVDENGLQFSVKSVLRGFEDNREEFSPDETKYNQ